VARQAADLVLTDDNLSTVVDAVREGRRIYDNIRRFLRYALSGGLAELVIMLVGPVLGLAVPLLPAQILWVNLLTHGLPGVALAAEPASPDLMTRPPRPAEESILGAGLTRTVLVTGALIAATVLGAGVVAAHTGAPWQSVVFVVLGLAQLGVALAVRARRTPGGPRNHGLVGAVALSAVLQVAAVTWAPLRELLSTQPLTVAELAVCTLAAAIPGVALAATRAVTHRRAGLRRSS
jgi:Ca2+-transporting ATPase